MPQTNLIYDFSDPKPRRLVPLEKYFQRIITYYQEDKKKLQKRLLSPYTAPEMGETILQEIAKLNSNILDTQKRLNTISKLKNGKLPKDDEMEHLCHCQDNHLTRALPVLASIYKKMSSHNATLLKKMLDTAPMRTFPHEPFRKILLLETNILEFPNLDALNLEHFSSATHRGSDLSRLKCFTIGDMHGNFLKMIHFITAIGLVSMPKETYQAFVSLYQKNTDYDQDDIKSFKAQLESVTVDLSKHVRFIGDMLADRGKFDLFTLMILAHLKEKALSENQPCPYSILVSNHDSVFILWAELDFPNTETFLQSTNPLMLRYPEQMRSLLALMKAIANGTAETQEVKRLYDFAYKPALKLFDADFSTRPWVLPSPAQTESNLHLVIYSHALIGLKTIYDAAKHYQLDFQMTFEVFSNLPVKKLKNIIDMINEFFLKEKSIATNKYLVPTDYTIDQDCNNAPFFITATWSRGKPIEPTRDSVTFVNGHNNGSFSYNTPNDSFFNRALPDHADIDTTLGRPKEEEGTLKFICTNREPRSLLERLQSALYNRMTSESDANNNCNTLMDAIFLLALINELNARLLSTKLQLKSTLKILDPQIHVIVTGLTHKHLDAFFPNKYFALISLDEGVKIMLQKRKNAECANDWLTSLILESWVPMILRAGWAINPLNPHRLNPYRFFAIHTTMQHYQLLQNQEGHKFLERRY